MTFKRQMCAGFAVMISSVMAGPSLAAGQDHPACNATAFDRPTTCPPIADIASLSPAVRSSHIFFPAGGNTLDRAAQDQLTALTAVLGQQSFAGTCLRLVGHTDPTGPEDINLQLSYLRAQAVAEFLITQMGTAAPEMTIQGQGEMVPLTNLPKNSLAHRRVALEARPCTTRARAIVTE